MIRVSALWRHPVKGVGAEPLQSTILRAGECLPGDRAFAIAQQGAETTGTWAACRNFVRGAKAGSLMAVSARPDGDNYIFTHPDRPDLRVALPAQGDDLIAWIRPLYPDNRPAPERLVTSREQGMTDAAFPSISLLSDASRSALGSAADATLDRRRFRGNIWLDGLEPWDEWDWIGKRLRIGAALLEVRERITRCRATHATPVTGRDDLDLLNVLAQNWGHRDFGVYAVCVEGGEVHIGDEATVHDRTRS